MVEEEGDEHLVLARGEFGTKEIANGVRRGERGSATAAMADDLLGGFENLFVLRWTVDACCIAGSRVGCQISVPLPSNAEATACEKSTNERLIRLLGQQNQ